MSSEELARRIGHWTRLHKFCGIVSTRREGDSYVVQFVARTTKTRASSMVTRVGLIAREVVVGTEFEVGKELMEDPPEDRDSLSSWKIFVRIAIRRRKEAA